MHWILWFFFCESHINNRWLAKLGKKTFGLKYLVYYTLFFFSTSFFLWEFFLKLFVLFKTPKFYPTIALQCTKISTHILWGLYLNLDRNFFYSYFCRGIADFALVVPSTINKEGSVCYHLSAYRKNAKRKKDSVNKHLQQVKKKEGNEWLLLFFESTIDERKCVWWVPFVIQFIRKPTINHYFLKYSIA